MNIKHLIAERLRCIGKIFTLKLKPNKLKTVVDSCISSDTVNNHLTWKSPVNVWIGCKCLPAFNVGILNNSGPFKNKPTSVCLCVYYNGEWYYFPLVAVGGSCFYKYGTGEQSYGTSRVKAEHNTSGSVTLRIYNKAQSKWLVIPNKWTYQEQYTLSYNLNSGSGTVPSSQTMWSNNGESVTVASVPTLTRTGYILQTSMWQKSSGSAGSGGTVQVGVSLSLTSNTVLYAMWVAQSYTVTYNLNGGTNASSNPSTYTIEDAITFANPTRLGWNFSYWSVASIAKGSTGNVSTTAYWTIRYPKINLTYGAKYYNSTDGDFSCTSLALDQVLAYDTTITFKHLGCSESSSQTISSGSTAGTFVSLGNGNDGVQKFYMAVTWNSQTRYYTFEYTNTTNTYTYKTLSIEWSSMSKIEPSTYDIPAGTYTPSTFKELIAKFITLGSYRTVSNAFSVTVNGKTRSVSSGAKIYYLTDYVSGSSSAKLTSVSFGDSNGIAGFAYAMLNFGSSAGHYIVGYSAGSGNYFPTLGSTYYNYSITVTTGFSFK